MRAKERNEKDELRCTMFRIESELLILQAQRTDSEEPNVAKVNALRPEPLFTI